MRSFLGFAPYFCWLSGIVVSLLVFLCWFWCLRLYCDYIALRVEALSVSSG